MAKGGQGTPVTQESHVNYSPEQQELFKLALPWAKQYAAQTPEVYQGKTRAGFTPAELEAQQRYLAQVTQLNQLSNSAATTQKFLLSPDQLDPTTNPYLDKMGKEVTRQVSDKFNQSILPGIAGSAVTAGGMYSGGSTRQQMAERLAGTDAVRAMETGLNDLYGTNYARGIQTMQNAVQNNPSVLGQQLFGADVMGAVGGQQRAMEQGGLDDAFMRWNLQQQLPFLRASELMGLAGGMPSNGTTTTVSGATPQGVSPWQAGFGGALSGAGLGATVGGPWGAMIGGLLGGVGGYGMNRYGSRW